MQQTVESNRTLLVDGPAAVRLVCGNAEVFGYRMKEEKRVIVKRCKRLPFYAVEKSVFEIHLGANANVQEASGTSIPQSWNNVLEPIAKIQTRPVVVTVIGQSDSGKSSLCAYLVNKLLKDNCKVAVLDGDIGQSDIGPSATVGYGIATKHITKLYNIKLTNAFFVGNTSPTRAISRVLEGLTVMKTELLGCQPDYILVNTDGWVTGDLAVKYKQAMISHLKPDLVVGIQIADELNPIMTDLPVPVVLVEPSPALSERSPEKRKNLREMTYVRYLRRSKLRCYPVSQLKVEPRNSIPKNQVPEEGVLVGLYGHDSKFLGIGVLRSVNQVRRILKVQTAVSAKPVRLVFGRVILNKKLQELSD